jgi:beta-phosphoglucomutase
MKIKAFIFDLDGVIVDTAKYHFLAWQKLAKSLDITFTQEHNEQLKGVSRVKSLELILGLGNIRASDAEKDLWMTQKNADYLSYIEKMDAQEVLPGVLDVLKYLKSKAQYVVLGSASKNAKPILEKAGINHFFDAIVDGNDVTNAKPDPEVFLQGAKKVGVLPSECIVFEDALAGIQAANAAGMTSIGIGEAEVLKEANYVFADFTPITFSFLDRLINQ